jgi:NADH dehydrogenase FAD-containing subunit
VTLIDRQYDHVFELLLYQVACGSLSPDEISALLRSVLKRVLIADEAIFEYD